MHTHKVIVAFSLGSIAGRDCLSGVFDFVNAGHRWNIQFVQDPAVLTADFVSQTVRDGASGFITGFREQTSGLRVLETTDIPVVFTDYPRNETPNAARKNRLIRNDDISIGREGAAHFLSHGNFRSFAFVPTETASRWSTLRKRGFRLKLGEAGIKVTTFRGRESLTKFLLALPKPTAVMAATDYDAVRVVEACQSAKLPIPTQVAVIGVDNDELLCNSVRPTLSSIQPDHEGLGRLGAEILDCLMDGRKIPRHIPNLVRSRGVVERDSTKIVPPAGHIVRAALNYIKSNAAKGIGVDDVVRHLGISRRLLYFRFRQMNERPIHKTIVDIRLALARKKLVQTTLSLKQIAAECGFASANRLSHLFHERFNTYPSSLRKSNRAQNP